MIAIVRRSNNQYLFLIQSFAIVCTNPRNEKETIFTVAFDNFYYLIYVCNIVYIFHSHL